MRRSVDTSKMTWLNEPEKSIITPEKVIIETMPHTNMWNRTHFGFIKRNAPALLFPMEFNFTYSLKMEYKQYKKYDQSGMMIYVNEDNWFKIGIEYVDETMSMITSTVTYHGFSDASTKELASGINTMYFKLSHRNEDFKIENSFDGQHYKPMRIFHLKNRTGKFEIGVYACSPLDSSFDVTFSEMYIGDCEWKPYEGEEELWK